MLQKLSFSIATEKVVSLTGLMILAGLAMIPAKASVLFQPETVFCDSSTSTISTGILPERDGVQGLKVFGTCQDPSILGEQVVVVQGGSGGPDAFLSDNFFISWEFSVTSSLNNDVTWVMTMNLNEVEVLYYSETGASGTMFKGSAMIPVPGFQPGATTLNSWGFFLGASANDEAPNFSMVSIVIPPNSLDIATDPPAELPEPGTLYAGMLAMIVVIGSVRYKRRSAPLSKVLDQH
jgi:hypothetical protein